MLSFGFISDRLGRKSGAVLTTLFLSLGIIMTAVSHGTSNKGLFWMLTISRGVAGFGFVCPLNDWFLASIRLLIMIVLGVNTQSLVLVQLNPPMMMHVRESIEGLFLPWSVYLLVI